MVKQDKLSVDKTGNTHNHESEMDHSKPEAAASSDQGPFSSDPFAANYRTVVDLNDPKVLATFAEFEALTGLRFTRKQRQILHSVEWTERMRPTDQLTVILKERGLLERYSDLFVRDSPADERFKSLQSLFHEEAPDLMDRFMSLWKQYMEPPAPIYIPGFDDRESKL